MRPALIESLICPYCGGALRLGLVAEERGGDVHYGLAHCRCFTHPIVEGVLLISLSKGYGGAEESLQPYAPLQAVAVQLLEQRQLPTLKQWICTHIPLAAPFIRADPGPYLEFSSTLAARLDREVADFLDDHSRYGVLWPMRGVLNRAVRRLGRSLRPAPSGREHQLAQLEQFYPTRFFSPYSQSAMLQLGQLPLRGRVLSLCCGQGMFENLLAADGRATEVISVDGQFLNLLATRHFVRPQGQFICQDVQLGLPFADNSFDAVFSSTCLPEIPTQRHFAREAVRVTSPRGWTWFDCAWNGELGGARINPWRFYRFAQNFFEHLEDYVDFFSECAGGRATAIAVPTAAAAYRDAAPDWTHEPRAIVAKLAQRQEAQLSALVFDHQRFPGFVAQPERNWATVANLAVSPVFEARAEGGAIHLARRAGFEKLSPNFAPKAFAGYPATGRINRADLASTERLLSMYCEGLLTVLPRNFDSPSNALSALQGA
ncbi:MAG TPA: class I SAM-dependent methyltransferase [Verrucomicrobiae bacterium]|nr:class I SAM-dependent methyltransferase [Verrucomicrobiae bacterium]